MLAHCVDRFLQRLQRTRAALVILLTAGVALAGLALLLAAHGTPRWAGLGILVTGAALVITSVALLMARPEDDEDEA